jgi:hypothetical protein
VVRNPLFPDKPIINYNIAVILGCSVTLGATVGAIFN